jgi:hypothetical protein
MACVKLEGAAIDAPYPPSVFASSGLPADVRVSSRVLPYTGNCRLRWLTIVYRAEGKERIAKMRIGSGRKTEEPAGEQA